jgi:hypothetical protein
MSMTERMREPLAHRRGLRQDEHDDPDDVKLPELNLIRYGGDGDRSVVVCGWFAYEREVPNPPGGGAPEYFPFAGGAAAERPLDGAVDPACRPLPGFHAYATRARLVVGGTGPRGKDRETAATWARRQQALLKRCRLNGLARDGKYSLSPSDEPRSPSKSFILRKL